MRTCDEPRCSGTAAARTGVGSFPLEAVHHPAGASAARGAGDLFAATFHLIAIGLQRMANPRLREEQWITQ